MGNDFDGAREIEPLEVQRRETPDAVCRQREGDPRSIELQK
jgi:hypothetical protein